MITAGTSSKSAAVSVSTRSGRPIANIAMASLGPSGAPDVQVVTRSCRNVTISGLITSTAPHALGLRP